MIEEHQPINWDNRWLLEKYFPDMPPVDLPVPAWNPNACAENRALAALRVWLRVWYHPTVIMLPKYQSPYRHHHAQSG